MNTCDNCGRENPTHKNLSKCLFCGSVLKPTGASHGDTVVDVDSTASDTVKLCHRCGAELPVGVDVCIFCGAMVSESYDREVSSSKERDRANTSKRKRRVIIGAIVIAILFLQCVIIPDRFIGLMVRKHPGIIPIRIVNWGNLSVSGSWSLLNSYSMAIFAVNDDGDVYFFKGL